ncbi:MAG: hypothetical protein JW929_13975 [Anaerolineales bacterium]|nr:hypothetical protein [Anaerolineales bacterium]
MTVTVALESDASGTIRPAVEFAPNEAGYSLYGKDLPRKGVDGAGQSSSCKRKK